MSIPLQSAFPDIIVILTVEGARLNYKLYDNDFRIND
jgi:hypothetical protein